MKSKVCKRYSVRVGHTKKKSSKKKKFFIVVWPVFSLLFGYSLYKYGKSFFLILQLLTIMIFLLPDSTVSLVQGIKSNLNRRVYFSTHRPLPPTAYTLGPLPVEGLIITLNLIRTRGVMDADTGTRQPYSRGPTSQVLRGNHHPTVKTPGPTLMGFPDL